MDDSDLSEDVRRAVAQYVDSLALLEALLLLYRNQAKAFGVDEAAHALGMAPPATSAVLETMAGRGLIKVDGTACYRYAPASEAIAAAVAKIAFAYGDRRIALINHIASKALTRIRELADAFRLG